jgi:hypothetical protein
MIGATYLRYIVQRIRKLIYPGIGNKSLVVPLLSAQEPSSASASSAPASKTNANPLFWKEEEQRQRNQEVDVRRT